MKVAAAILPALLASVAAAGNHARVEAIIDHDALPVGGSANVALVFTIDPGWHLYWQNPGDTGEPPRVEWALPDGLVGGKSLQFPTPHRLDAGGVTAFGYENKLVLLTTLTRSKPGPGSGTATVHWMACDAQQCVAEKQTISLNLPAGDGSPRMAERFSEWRAAQPDRPTSGGDTAAIDMTVAPDGRNGHLDVPVPAGMTGVDYFPPRFEFLAYEKATAVGNVMRTPFRVLSDAPPVVAGNGVLVFKDNATAAVRSQERPVRFVRSESQGAQ